MNVDGVERISLDELCTLVSIGKRTVRFYIQSGLLARPVGEKRGAYYTQEHLEQLLKIKQWKERGVSLDRIRELIEEGVDLNSPIPPRPVKQGGVEVWSRIHVEDGIELQIQANRSRLTPEQVRVLVRGVADLMSSIREKEH
jgi:DNA-binding transcriptional MerR regulator